MKSSADVPGVAALSIFIDAVAKSVDVVDSFSSLECETVQKHRTMAGRLIVTPRMHGIYYSIVQSETNSNWSSRSTVWDRLHGTLRRDVRQDAIVIGVPSYRQPQEVTLPKVLALPFSTSAPPGKRRKPTHKVRE